MTTLILVRHGQSASNVAQLFTGQGNTLLTELGHEQAKRTAKYLSRFRIDKIYASDLSRAAETARYTAQAQGVDVILEPAFREIMAGDWEGQSYTALLKRYPESYGQWLHDIGRAHPENGESVKELAARVYAKTDEILAENRGKCIAIFTHATPVRMMGCRWLGYELADAHLVPFGGNASVSIAEYEDDGTFRLISYAYDGHQGDAVSSLPNDLV